MQFVESKTNMFKATGLKPQFNGIRKVERVHQHALHLVTHRHIPAVRLRWKSVGTKAGGVAPQVAKHDGSQTGAQLAATGLVCVTLTSHRADS